MRSYVPNQQDTVLIVGDVILDQYIHGCTSRISPEAPVPVVSISGCESRPGGAANVARNLCAAGVRACLVGAVGEDSAAQELRDLLDRADVRHHLHVAPGCSTIVKQRVVCNHQQLLRMDREEGAPLPGGTLLDQCRQLIDQARLMVLSDYAKGGLLDVQAYIGLARDKGIPVLVDPKGRDFSRYRGATLIAPNQSELEAVVGRCSDLEALSSRAEALRQELELEAVLLTRGEHGMLLLERGKPPVSLRTEARDVYDVTGAGDTVIAVLAAAIVSGYALPEATRIANVAAGIVVGRLGTAVAYPHEINCHGDGGKVVVADTQFLHYLNELRARGQRIVMGNGCFDIIHAGHIHYLQQARACGDCLIVAVNDDASVRRLKGAARPMVPLQQRLQVLAALECVDWLLAFDTDTPEELITRIAPDVLVKGEDYQQTEIAGARQVRARQGEVKTLPLVPGCSSSAIIDACQRRGA